MNKLVLPIAQRYHTSLCWHQKNVELDSMRTVAHSCKSVHQQIDTASGDLASQTIVS